jgi:FkbM family methyltransferase
MMPGLDRRGEVFLMHGSRDKVLSPCRRIPKVLHFSVPTPMLQQQRDLIETARLMHPNWEMRIWDDNTPIESARLAKYRNHATSGAQRADLIRLDAIYAFGGVYLDADFQVLRPFDDLVENYEFFMASEDGYALTNALIAAMPQHPALDLLINFLEQNEPDWSLPPNETTGPAFFTRLLRWRSDVNILPRDTFYPYNWNERPKPAHRLSYAQHLWDYSWSDKASQLSARHIALTGHMNLGKSAVRSILRLCLSALRRARSAADPASTNVREVAFPGGYMRNPELVVRTVHGQKIVLDGHDLSITPDVALHGYYKWPEEAFIRRVVKGGDWFVDVGSNAGIFSVLAASLCGPLGRVLAFEPIPNLRELLARSAIINSYHDRIKIYDATLGDAEGTAVFCYYPERLGHTQSYATASHRQCFWKTDEILQVNRVEVRVCSLDNIIRVDLPVKVLRIGTNGHGPKILRGAKRLLAVQAFEFILLEVSLEFLNTNWSELLDSLQSLVTFGYTVATFDNEGNTITQPLSQALRGLESARTLVFSASQRCDGRV